MADRLITGVAATEADRLFKRIETAKNKLATFKAGAGQQTRISARMELADLYGRLGELVFAHSKVVRVKQAPHTATAS